MIERSKIMDWKECTNFPFGQTFMIRMEYDNAKKNMLTYRVNPSTGDFYLQVSTLTGALTKIYKAT